MRIANRRAAFIVVVAVIALTAFSNDAVDVPGSSRAPRASSILTDATDEVFKDIIVNVKETATVNLMFGAGINADAALIDNITVEANSSQERALPADYR